MIVRLQAECRVAGNATAASGFRERTTRSLGLELGGAIQKSWGNWFDRPDDSVWIVRRLDLTLHVNGEARSDTLADRFAESLGQVLGETLVGNGDGHNSIRFESHVAYLGQFLLDNAAGDAAARWYYAPFSGLEALTPSAAIRTALLADPERGQAALAALDDRDLTRVCSALSEADEQLVLDGLAATCEGSEASADETYSAAWTGCERAREAGPDRCRPLHALIRTPGLVRSGQLVTAARHVPALAKAARIEEAGSTGPVKARRAPAAVGMDRSNTPAAVTRAIAAPPDFTWFGGLLLLLSELERLPWDEWTAGWPGPRGASAGAVLQWLTTALCAGRERQGAALDDPVVRSLLGITHELTGREVGRWLRRAGPRRQAALRKAIEKSVGRSTGPQARTWFGVQPGSEIGAAWVATLVRAASAVLRRFAARLPGFAESSPAHLWRNVLGFDARVEHEPERVVVRCGRPPLQLLLSITGMIRGTPSGHDATGRPIYLFPQE